MSGPCLTVNRPVAIRVGQEDGQQAGLQVSDAGGHGGRGAGPGVGVGQHLGGVGALGPLHVLVQAVQQQVVHCGETR